MLFFDYLFLLSLVYLFNYIYSCGFRVIISFVSINTTQRIAPLLCHGCSLYRRDGEDDDAAMEV